MLMPGRYISDTAKHCVTINSTVLIPKQVKVYLESKTVGKPMQIGGSPAPIAVSNLPMAAKFAKEKLYVYHYVSAVEHPGGWVVKADSADNSVAFSIDLSHEPSGLTACLLLHADTAQETQQFGFDFTTNGAYRLDVRVRQYDSAATEEYHELMGWTAVTTGGHQQYTISTDKHSVLKGGKTILEFKVTSGNGASFATNTMITVGYPWTYQTVLVPENHVVTVCDEKDNYRWNYNGIEKVNEVAGLGNHYAAFYGEYDPRLGSDGRWNRDPKPSAGISPYSMYKGNPIIFSDPLLDKVIFMGYRPEENTPMSLSNATKMWGQMVDFLKTEGLNAELDALDKSPIEYRIYFTTTSVNNYFIPAVDIHGNLTSTAEIQFNPFEAHLTKKNYWLSPIEGFGHELGHAFDFDQDPCAYHDRENVRDEQYGFVADRRVIEGYLKNGAWIEGIEQRFAKKIGNLGFAGKTRDDHEPPKLTNKVKSWKPEGHKGGEAPGESKEEKKENTTNNQSNNTQNKENKNSKITVSYD